MSSASACAKIILVGEHAVVYNKPAIAAPFSSLRAAAMVEQGPAGTGIQIFAVDHEKALPLNLADTVHHALARVIELVLVAARLSAPPDFRVTISSQIPPASGLGSGAALSTALARALLGALHVPLPVDDLNDLVYEVEKIYHGTPSGIDNTVIVRERLIYFRRGLPIELIKPALPLTLLIGDTGQPAPTRVSVGAVADLVRARPSEIIPVIDAIGEVAQRARGAIERGNLELLGRLMLQNHELLQKLTVSSGRLDALVRAAVDAGAVGAKLSGGGRGGNMVALVTSDQREPVRAALWQAGAVNVYETQVQ